MVRNQLSDSEWLDELPQLDEAGSHFNVSASLSFLAKSGGYKGDGELFSELPSTRVDAEQLTRERASSQ
jgi:hypothetical protein